MKPETLPRARDGGKNSELGARALARALSQLQHMLNTEPSTLFLGFCLYEMQEVDQLYTCPLINILWLYFLKIF